MLRKIPGLNHIPNQHRVTDLLGTSMPTTEILSGIGGNSDAGGAQGQGDIIRQIGELGKLDALLQHKLIPGYGGPWTTSPGGLHAEAHQSFRQAAGVSSAPHRPPCGFLLAGLEQSNGGN